MDRKHVPISGGFYIAPGKALWRAQCLCGWLGNTNRTENAANNRVKTEHIKPLAEQNQGKGEVMMTNPEGVRQATAQRPAVGGTVPRPGGSIALAVNSRLAYDGNHSLAGAWIDAENKLTDTQFLAYQQVYRQRAGTD